MSKFFSPNFTVEDIRSAVVEWSELLAQGNYAEALAMFELSKESFEIEWTPDLFEEWISNYGMFRADYDSGEYRKVTSLFDQPDPNQFIEQAIKVEKRTFEGRDPGRYIGWVHYDDVPLDGHPSDLTARFFIVRTPGSAITLEFLDIHVM